MVGSSSSLLTRSIYSRTGLNGPSYKQNWRNAYHEHHLNQTRILNNVFCWDWFWEGTHTSSRKKKNPNKQIISKSNYSEVFFFFFLRWMSQAWWYMPIVLSSLKLRQDDYMFKTSWTISQQVLDHGLQSETVSLKRKGGGASKS